MTFLPPNPLYVGPAAHTMTGSNKPVHRIVLHSTVSPCEQGGAAKVARYFRSPESGGSAHYVVDPGVVLQVVYDSVIAEHAPPNPHSLGIEMCDMPAGTLVRWDDPATDLHSTRKNPLRWIEPNHRKMLRRVALLTAELCLAYDVPVVFLSSADLVAGKHGITTHANVSMAWNQSTHWDPGLWPKRSFMRQVRKDVKRLKAAQA